MLQFPYKLATTSVLSDDFKALVQRMFGLHTCDADLPGVVCAVLCINVELFTLKIRKKTQTHQTLFIYQKLH